MPIVRGQWAELLAPGLNMMSFSSYTQFPEFYRQIVNVQNSRRAYEDSFRVAGFGPLAPKGELETTILDEPLKIGGVRFFHKTFALGFAISQEMRDDVMYQEMLGLAQQLGLSSYWTSELYGHDVLNNGFSSAKYVGRDGLSLFNTAHPIQGPGTTMANRPTVDTDLTEAALEAAILGFDLMQNERGMPIMWQPRTLLVHPENRLFVVRLLQSAGFPGTNQNDVNPLQGLGLVGLSDPWLTDHDAWFVLAAQNLLGLRFWWREMPDTKTWDDDNADATFHKIRQRHSVGFDDWRGTYGSPGSGP